MATCTTCGAQLGDGDRFCPDCGTPVPVAQGAVDPAPAILAFGPYVLTGVVGRGATSIVYRASVAGTGDEVAVKVLDPALARVPGFQDQLEAESSVLSSLSGPHVVRGRGTGVIEGHRYLAMDYVEGSSLRAVEERAGRLRAPQALGLVAGALEGLGAAHAKGIVHGDVKPENILIDRAGTATVVDFGQVVSSGGATEGGTPPYMSPEAARGLPLDARSDLYSMGVVLYEALAGHRPFEATNDLALLRLQVEATPAPIDGVSAEMNALVGRALAKDPADRPQDAAAFLRELEAAAARDYGGDWKRRAAVAALVTVAVDAVVAPSPALAAGGGTGAASATATGGGVVSSHPVAAGIVAVVLAAGLVVGGVAFATRGGSAPTAATLPTTTTSTTPHGTSATKGPTPVLEAGILYNPSGSEYGAFGNGKVRPESISTSGVGASSGVQHIVWKSWGGPTATGTGTGCVTTTGTESQCTVTKATVVAYNLGTCTGKPAYLTVIWYFPSLGETLASEKAKSGTPTPNPSCGGTPSSATSTTSPSTLHPASTTAPTTTTSSPPPASTATAASAGTLGPLVGTWGVHGSGIAINSDGSFNFSARTYRWCGTGVPTPCDSEDGTTIVTGIQITGTLHSTGPDSASGTVNTSTTPGIGPGSPLTVSFNSATGTVTLSLGSGAKAVPLCGATTSDPTACGE